MASDVQQIKKDEEIPEDYQSKLSPQQQTFIRAFLSGGHEPEAVRVAGVHRTTFWRWKKNADFLDAMAWARHELRSNAETTLYAAGLEGNMTALIFYLKHNWPDKYGERAHLVIEDQRPAASVDTSSLRPEEKRALMKALAKNAPKEDLDRQKAKEA
jgi:hypothetical protein